MRSGASGEPTELARRRMTSAVLRLVAYVITPVSEVQRLGRVDQPARTRTRDADVQVGEVLEHALRPLWRVGVAMDVYLYPNICKSMVSTREL